MTSQPFNLCIPSKTFLIGEYSVLSKSKAIIIAHAPYFQCVPRQNSNWPSHPAVQDYINISREFAFIDPHQGQGGFGASSALIIALAHHLKPFDVVFAHSLNNKYHPNSSGADVIGQYFGNLSLINTKTHSATPITLAPNWAITILKTPIKVNSHQHLCNLPLYNADHLNTLIENYIENSNDINVAAKIINDYENVLQSHDLRHPSTIDYIKAIQNIPNVLAVKGCGALGADVLLILSHKSHQMQIIGQLPKSLTVVANQQDIAKGIL